MATLFTKIIQGEIPASFVWKDELSVAFMSINPLRPGHTLVVPREEVDHWIDCPAPLREHLLDVARQIGQAQLKVYRPQRIGLVIAGLEVPHLHLHVVPINNAADLEFSWAAKDVETEALEQAASSIRYILRSMGSTGVVEEAGF
ncbi:MAG TPA: HIT family protein [Acidimicrobiia bacterium]|nr:HIT family protein [Acidimicrobiia bacterium]